MHAAFNDGLCKVKAVVFDNDGTLVDSMAGIVRSWAQLAEEYGGSGEVEGNFHGRSSADIIRELLGVEEAERAMARIDELEVQYAGDTTAHAGVPELLAALPDDRFAVASSGTHAVIDARLSAAHIDRPAVVVSADDVDHAKPAPDIFLAACAGLGYPPSECLVVEDAASGVQAGKAAGCPVLAVTTTTPAEQLQQAGADLVVASLVEVELRLVDDWLEVRQRRA